MEEEPKRKRGRPKGSTNKRKPGRPSSLTPVVIRNLTNTISESGVSYKSACLLAGISYASFMRYMKQGREDYEVGKENEYTTFYLQVEKAKEHWRYKAHRKIEGSPPTLLKLLQLRFPKDYIEPKREVELKSDVNHSGSIDFNIRQMSDEELDKTIEELLNR